MLRKKNFFYFLSFFEGACVMAAELLGAKMLAPFFGSSLYVWSSVLGITLGGLASGYFAGGLLSQKKNTERNLYYVLLFSAVFLLLMPLLAKAVMLLLAPLPLTASVVISSFIFLFPPIFFMGMVSPMIVQCIAHPHPFPVGREKVLPFGEDLGGASGKIAGTVYAVSTIGGIISTFLFGFYLIPTFGLTKPAIAMGIVLGTIPFVKLITNKKFSSLIFIIVALMALNGAFQSPLRLGGGEGARHLYSSEGLLGQVVVADYFASPLNPLSSRRGEKGLGVVRGEADFQRVLLVNRTIQTLVRYEKGKKSFLDYVNVILGKVKSDSISENQNSEVCKALVLGLGGGCVANELAKKGFSVDAVELDERIAEAAKKYFELNQKVKITIDDARHFVNGQGLVVSGQKIQLSTNNYPLTTDNGEKYNIIVLDAFIGESNPHHLFTKEFFREVKTILSDSGIFFINGNGFWNGEAGRGMRSVCKTLLASGFDVEVLPTGKEQEHRNLLFIAKLSGDESGKIISKEFSSHDLSDVIVLTDEKPQLELLNAEANKRWRKAYLECFLNNYISGKDSFIFQ